MEKIKNFFKSLLLRLSICGNLALFSIWTKENIGMSNLFILGIPVVLFWNLGVLKLCWKIIKGFFSIFAGGGSSNNSSNIVNTETVRVEEPKEEPEQIITAYRDGGNSIFVETTKGSSFIGFYDDELLGFTSSTVTIKHPNGSVDVYDVHHNIIRSYLSS